jgi:hypothetical protein
MFVRQPGGHAFLTEHNVPVYNITIKPVTKKERSTELEDFLTKLVRKEAILAEQEGRTCDISAPPFVTDCDYDQANITQVRKKTLLTEQGGLACGVSAPPFITDCAYNQAKAILEWIYVSNESALARPSTEAQGSFIAFDQRQYAKDGDGFADDGVVYLPSSCQQQIGCRVHVALHGCDQSRETVGDAFIKESGFAEMADTNRFVILFPQTKATEVNPHGCWDWWGYTGLDYLGKGAPQIAAIWAMVEHLAKSPEVQP